MMIIIISNVKLYVFSTGPAIEVFKALLYCDSNQLSEEHDRQLGERARERERERQGQRHRARPSRQPGSQTNTHSHTATSIGISLSHKPMRNREASKQVGSSKSSQAGSQADK